MSTSSNSIMQATSYSGKLAISYPLLDGDETDGTASWGNARKSASWTRSEGARGRPVRNSLSQVEGRGRARNTKVLITERPVTGKEGHGRGPHSPS